jgi:long-chain acyl-CoA synthetase
MFISLPVVAQTTMTDDEVMEYVNSKVNRFSKITKVIDNEGEFEKTPTKKIRRYNILNRNKDNQGEEQK